MKFQNSIKKINKPSYQNQIKNRYKMKNKKLYFRLRTVTLKIKMKNLNRKIKVSMIQTNLINKIQISSMGTI